MKRRIFFWIEKLKITPAERKAVSTLVVLLVVLGMINAALSPPVPFAKEHYRELEKQFKKRTALLGKKRQKLMRRYHPSVKKPMAAAGDDTVTQDTSANENVKNDAPDVSNMVINVNNARQEALESLPGIGPVYARRIIKYRQEHGKFKTVEELKKIKGIGEKRLEKLKPFVKLTDSEK